MSDVLHRIKSGIHPFEDKEITETVLKETPPKKNLLEQETDAVRLIMAITGFSDFEALVWLHEEAHRLNVTRQLVRLAE
tara:strand:- start:66 stop:302 length:237 start_codon:yes stop_codon:yes gene_type:complete